MFCKGDDVEALYELDGIAYKATYLEPMGSGWHKVRWKTSPFNISKVKYLKKDIPFSDFREGFKEMVSFAKEIDYEKGVLCEQFANWLINTVGDHPGMTWEIRNAKTYAKNLKITLKTKNSARKRGVLIVNFGRNWWLTAPNTEDVPPELRDDLFFPKESIGQHYGKGDSYEVEISSERLTLLQDKCAQMLRTISISPLPIR